MLRVCLLLLEVPVLITGNFKELYPQCKPTLYWGEERGEEGGEEGICISPVV